MGINHSRIVQALSLWQTLWTICNERNKTTLEDIEFFDRVKNTWFQLEFFNKGHPLYSNEDLHMIEL